MKKKGRGKERPPMELLNTNKNNNIPDSFSKFLKENLCPDFNKDLNLILIGNNLYHVPFQMPDLSEIKVIKIGLYLGKFTNNRFEPSHSFCLSLKKQEFKNTIDLSSDSKEIVSYLKGETLFVDGKNGHTAICVDGFTIG